MTRLTPTDFEGYARKLQDRQRALLAEIREQIEDGDEAEVAALRERFDNLDPHDDLAAGDWAREVTVLQVVRDTRELDEVVAALARIADGSYGECLDCGKAIPRARLDANPAAVRCVPCQEKVETKAAGIPRTAT